MLSPSTSSLVNNKQLYIHIVNILSKKKTISKIGVEWNVDKYDNEDDDNDNSVAFWRPSFSDGNRSLVIIYCKIMRYPAAVYYRLP